MDKPKEVPGYVYCKTCDIYYSKKLFDQTEKVKAKLLKSRDDFTRRLALNIESCPLCRAKTREAFHSLSASFREGHSGLIRPSLRLGAIKSAGPMKRIIFLKKAKK